MLLFSPLCNKLKRVAELVLFMQLTLKSIAFHYVTFSFACANIVN